MKINKQFYYDRVSACWLGKNIGGTMGAPYEGKTEMQDITGFNSPKGEPLPNDDLDLQLIWLCALEERGVKGINEKVLGEYWINYIPGYWNEYGIGKVNMKLGLMPPYSGEYNNSKWRNSNGAWIRTEIWACIFPGFPELAARYAFYDACVDHGMGEGTYAAIFVAALESAAFFENDIRKLIETGLSFIPKASKVAQTVRLTIELYDKNVNYREAREKIVEFNSDLGMFQAPANVSFVILGLLYGGGDYKKSMIYAINCGDDTDCTGATIGSIMGIMYGSEKVPEDWAEYIGDRIISVAIDTSYLFSPKSCSELTRRTAELMPSALKAFGVFAEYTESETEREEYDKGRFHLISLPKTGLCVYFDDLVYAEGRAEFSTSTVKPGDEIEFTFTFINKMLDPKLIEIEAILPEGWTADRKVTSMMIDEFGRNCESVASLKVKVGENVNLKNIIKLKATSNARPASSEISIIIWG